MKNLFKTTFIALSLILTACGSDNNEVSITPKIRIEVKNHPLEEIKPNQTVSNATVLVYDSSNFEKEPVFRGVTNETGAIEFTENVEFDKKYYVDVEKSCSNNYNSLLYGSEYDFTVQAKNFDDIDLSTLKVSIRETGKVVLTNNSSNGYLIKILDKEVGTITVGETITFEYLPVNTSFWSLTNINNNEVLRLDDLASCGETKNYTIE